MIAGCDEIVSAGPSSLLDEWLRWAGLRIDLDFRPDTAEGENTVIGNRIMHNHAIEIAGPALRFTRTRICPIEAGLRIFILPFHRADFNREKDMVSVARPANLFLDGLIVSDLVRCGSRFRQIYGENFEFVYALVPLRNRFAYKSKLMSIGRSYKLFNAPRRGRNRNRAWR